MSKQEKKQKINKDLLAFALTAILIFSLVSLVSYNIGYSADQYGSLPLNQVAYYVGAPSEYTYIIAGNSTHSFCWSGTTGALLDTDTNDNNVINYAIDSASANIGGTVYIKAGYYSALSVVLKHNVDLIISQGATGITYTVNPGADCSVINRELFYEAHYENGALFSYIDYDSGTFYYNGENRTDFYDLTANYSTEGDYAYLIFENGGTYYMKNGTTGYIDYSGSDADITINYAVGNLTSGRVKDEKIVLEGSFTIDSHINLVSYVTFDLTEAIIYCDTNMNDNMFYYDGTGITGVKLYGGRLFGNATIQSAGGNCISITNSADVGGDELAKVLTMDKVYINGFDGWGIYANLAGGDQIDIYDCSIRNAYGGGIYAEAWDSRICNNIIESNMTQLYMRLMTDSVISGNYLGGTSKDSTESCALYLQGARRNKIIGNVIDNFTFDAIRLVDSSGSNSSKNEIVGNSISVTDQLDASNTYSGITLEDNACNNTISNNFIGRKKIEDSDLLAYGIEEMDNADFNSFSGNIYCDIATKNLLIVGQHPRLNVAVITFKAREAYYTESAPNTSYVECADRLIKMFDFDVLNPVAFKIVVNAVGNEAGNNKGLAIYDKNATAMLCEVTWNGNSAQNGLGGAWDQTNIPEGITIISPYVKGSSATEDISIAQIDLFILYE